jgi:hypothetical protein
MRGIGKPDGASRWLTTEKNLSTLANCPANR